MTDIEPTEDDILEDHHEIVTDPARIGYSEEQPGDAETRLGVCGVCGQRFEEVLHHVVVEHPDSPEAKSVGIPTDPNELRALADRIDAARVADGVRAEQNAFGGIDYAVAIDDAIQGTDEASA